MFKLEIDACLNGKSGGAHATTNRATTSSTSSKDVLVEKERPGDESGRGTGVCFTAGDRKFR